MPAKIIAAVALVNFFSFVIGTILLGGDALNGHTSNGHFFLANHGKLTETTESIFRYSKAHCISLFFTHPAAAIAIWLDESEKDES